MAYYGRNASKEIEKTVREYKHGNKSRHKKLDESGFGRRKRKNYKRTKK